MKSNSTVRRYICAVSTIVYNQKDCNVITERNLLAIA